MKGLDMSLGVVASMLLALMVAAVIVLIVTNNASDLQAWAVPRLNLSIGVFNG